MRSRLFLLEEENASLKREAELELPREVESLKHQVNWSSFCHRDVIAIACIVENAIPRKEWSPQS